MEKALVLALIAFCAPAAWAEVGVQNDRPYYNDGTMRILGEVYNDSDAPLAGLTIHATVYGKDGYSKEATASAMLDTLMPGMRAPFDVELGADGSTVSRYDLDVDYMIAPPKGRAIEITSSELTRDGLGNTIIRGTVGNSGDITANTISVIATLYGADKGVIAASEARTTPDYLRSSDEAHFVVHIPGGNADEAVSYSLAAESEEYAAVPEFPLGSGVLLAASLFAYSMMARFWGALTRAPHPGGAQGAAPDMAVSLFYQAGRDRQTRLVS